MTGTTMNWLRCATALLALAIACAPAWAADEFPRRGVVLLLGYDPEKPPVAECEKRTNIASLIRIGYLMKERSTAERMPLYLHLAGLFGAARAVCPPDKNLDPPKPLIAGGAKLDPAACLVARDHMRGPLRQSIDAMIQTEHTDVATGFAQGIAEVFDPVATACDPGEYWAALRADADILTRRAQSLKERRACSVWRRAGFDELKRAAELAKTHGRTAGRNRLDRQAMAAIGGARHYCGSDPISEAFEKTHYDLTVALIDSEPEKPAKN
jgi:hypothetical protein